MKGPPLDEKSMKDETLRDLSNFPSNEYVDDGSIEGDERIYL